MPRSSHSTGRICADTSPTRNSPVGTRTKHRYPVLIRVLSDRQNTATESASQTLALAGIFAVMSLSLYAAIERIGLGSR